MSYYREQLENWLKTLDVKADCVLDIGGAQGPVKDRVRSWDVKDYVIADLPETNAEIKIDMNNCDYRDNRGFDIIFCLEVFEYLYNPEEGIKNIFNFLKYGGKAYVTFAFIYPHHNELEVDSLRYTEPGIKRLANNAELKITNTWYRRDRSGLLQQFYSADGMKRAKQYPNHDVTGFIVEFTK